MIKLLHEGETQKTYWEVWGDGDKLIVHQGVVGETGTTNEQTVEAGQKQTEISVHLADTLLKQGFRNLTPDDYTDFAIQYRIEGFGTTGDLDKRHNVEALTDECLGWTGNGQCDGGDIGSRTINIYCKVLDVPQALATIKTTLSQHDALEGAILAHEENEDFTVLYPIGAQFQY